ncbi:MAG TPA: glycosyltransferase family 2 protein [Bacteroidota bacterium]|nr:glycosyltransferase family 2 protein [Bacteroidota bacterium]
MSHPIVSAIIVTYNSSGYLRGVLESLTDQVSEPRLEIIVVDNGSADDSCEIVASGYPGVRLVRMGKNVGFGIGCNEGAKLAGGDFLLFVNSDVILHGNPLPAILEEFGKHGDIGIIGCQLRNPDGTRQPSGFRRPGLFMRLLQLSGLKKMILGIRPSIRATDGAWTEADFVSGAFMIISRRFFVDLGGFDERYFMYLEDADLCYRSGLRGKKTLIYGTDAVIHHGRHYEVLENPFVFYHSNRGQIIFYKKFFSPWKWYTLSAMSLFFYSFSFVWSQIVRPPAEARDALRKTIALYRENMFSRSLPS